MSATTYRRCILSVYQLFRSPIFDPFSNRTSWLDLRWVFTIRVTCLFPPYLHDTSFPQTNIPHLISDPMFYLVSRTIWATASWSARKWKQPYKTIHWGIFRIFAGRRGMCFLYSDRLWCTTSTIYVVSPPWLSCGSAVRTCIWILWRIQYISFPAIPSFLFLHRTTSASSSICRLNCMACLPLFNSRHQRLRFLHS